MFKSITNKEALAIDKVVFAFADVTIGTVRKLSLPGYIYKGRFFQRFFPAKYTGKPETNPIIQKLTLHSNIVENDCISNIQIPIKGDFYILSLRLMIPSAYYYEDVLRAVNYDTIAIMHNGTHYAPFSIRDGVLYDDTNKCDLSQKLYNTSHCFVFINKQTYNSICRKVGRDIIPYGDMFYTSLKGVVFCTENQQNINNPFCINLEGRFADNYSPLKHLPYDGEVDDKVVSLDSAAFYKRYNKISDYHKNPYDRPLSTVKIDRTLTHNQSCADFIKNSNYKSFSYYTNLVEAAKAGNTEEDVKNWMEFISDLMEATVEIKGLISSTDLKPDNVKYDLYEMKFKNCVNVTNMSNYVRLVLLRYLMSTTKGYLPKLTMEIYEALKDKPSMTKWKAICIAHHTMPENVDDSFGYRPNPTAIKSLSELAKSASDRGMNSAFTYGALSINIDKSLFEKKEYETIYSQLKKHYATL